MNIFVQQEHVNTDPIVTVYTTVGSDARGALGRGPWVGHQGGGQDPTFSYPLLVT